MRKYIYVLIMLILFVPRVVFPQQGTWVTCSGEASLNNISYEEAQVLAKRRARLDAVEQVCGISIQAETMVNNFMLAADFIHSIAFGQVVEEKKLSWRTETIPPENPDTPPMMLLTLTMDARVIPVIEKPDPFFKVHLNLNRTVFQSGDEAVLTVRSTKDCYLTVFNLAANDSVYILLPNAFEPDGFVKADQVIEIPDNSLRETGMQFRVAALQGHTKDSEIVKVVATRQKAAFFEELDLAGGIGRMGTPKMAVAKMARWLSQIPVSERAEASISYEIHSR